MSSLRDLLQGASMPELKEALREFEARCPRSKEISQKLVGAFASEDRNSRYVLREVVEGVCERFQECRSAVEELLADGDEEGMKRTWVLDILGKSEDGESEKEWSPELEVVRRKKGKKRRVDLLSPPRKKAKNVKRESSHVARVDKSTPFQRALLVPSQRSAGRPLIQNSTSSSLAAPPSSAPKKRRTIDEIFAADKERRELEAKQEEERRIHEAEIRATCAQCTKFFLTDDNHNNSCIFHSGESKLEPHRECLTSSGTMRRYHPADRGAFSRWFCCGREIRNKGCMEAKHIDDRIPGEVERIKDIRQSAWEDAWQVVYRSCEECDEDIAVEFESEAESEMDSESTDLDIGKSEETEGVREVEEGRETEEAKLVEEKEEKEEAREADEASPYQADKRFLCHACTEEAAAKKLECRICGDEFKALPSHDAYSADKPVCGDCLWANMWHSEGWCSRCRKNFKLPMRPHWYESDPYDEDPCDVCRAKEYDEELELVEDG